MATTFAWAALVATVATAPIADSSVDAATPSTSKLVPVDPIRLADTRRADCGCERVDPFTTIVDVVGHARVPDDAIAAAITVTALPTVGPGHVTIWPAGRPRPVVSTVNTRPDRVVANSTIVPLSASGHLALFNLRGGDVIVDVTAVFVPAASSRDGRFVPMTGRRLADTRALGSPTGALSPRGRLAVPLPDGVPADAVAMVVNVTSVLERGPGHLSVHASDGPATNTSILNVDGSGTAVAASVIVPVGDGGFVVESFPGGHVVVDVLGWFTGPSAAMSTTGLFVPLGPQRLLDTRRTPGRIHAEGTIELASPIGNAGALVTNVTVVLPDRRGHVTAYPARTNVPGTSTVNPAFWNHTVANLAITRVSTAGIAYRSFGGTDLVVDVTGRFTGQPVAATKSAAPNTAARSRMLVVGDSTLAGVPLVPESMAAFVGVDAVIDAGPCRRLMRPSCLSNTTGLIPNTAVEAILGAAGTFDIVVIKTGYNDWNSNFFAEFHAVVQAARSKGAHTVLWLTYNENVSSPSARRAYTENNIDLRVLTALAQYHDVLLADWLTYSGQRQDWFWDGIHLTPDGAWALTDFISRWAAAVEHRPCPRPWTPGAALPDPCPAPEQVGTVPFPRGLY